MLVRRVGVQAVTDLVAHAAVKSLGFQ
jgi:hypothetical protein